MAKRVLVAMSGGVDSSVAAYLMIKQGYEVIGATMKLWPPEKSEGFLKPYCESDGVADAREVAQKLSIPFHVFSFQKEFETEVVDYFCSEYLKGRTPNPCILCNERLKFGYLLREAGKLGADFVATGHYAQVEYDNLTDRYILKKGRYPDRDQSYFLFSLSQEQLSHLLFPLGGYSKDEIRNIAGSLCLKVFDKRDSQEICFIKDNNYRRFLKERFPAKFKAGDIVDKNATVLGRHNGVFCYTIGQRKGLGIASSQPFYVTDLDVLQNRVVVGRKEDTYHDGLIACGVNWIVRINHSHPFEVWAKIRYRHKEAKAQVSLLSDGKVGVRFEKPQSAITTGQAVVFYDGSTVVGGGWIEKAVTALEGGTEKDEGI